MPAAPDRDSTRRDFLAAGVALAASAAAPAAAIAATNAGQDPPATAPEAGDITTESIARAEKLAGVEFTDAEREQLLKSVRDDVARRLKRRSIIMPNSLAPAQIFDPRPPGQRRREIHRPFFRSSTEPGPVPASEEDIAFAPLTALSRWTERRQITSEAVTKIYLDRLKRIGPTLQCVITLTEDLALRQARRADQEIASGHHRGVLHGIPWGAKDLFDTAGVRTTWGAEPFRDRVPKEDAWVVQKLEDAGAVLLGKLTLGALAYGDIWFDGRTNNPWDLTQGSSGSSAGSAAATAAGLVGFALGTETLGSIVSPCMACGTTGLRPTFGRVARTGAMALCWSLDKIGPICRRVEDCAMVLSVINGTDSGDASSIDVPFAFDANLPLSRMRVGYSKQWFEGRRVSPLDRTALEAVRDLGVELVEIKLPDWPYETLLTTLCVEAAAAFEDLTLSNRDDELDWQDDDAWPNTFRSTWFMPGIDYVQAERFRRQCMVMWAQKMEGLDAVISPSFGNPLLLLTNFTGYPSLTVRCGFDEKNLPHGITLWGNLFEEGPLCRIGMALEAKFNVWSRRPPI